MDYRILLIEVITVNRVMKATNTVLFYDERKFDGKEICEKIINSRFYVEHLDRDGKQYSHNPRYERYLEYKESIYMEQVIESSLKRPDRSMVYDEKIDKLYEIYIKDVKKSISDYTLNENRSPYVIRINILEDGIEIIDSEINRRYLELTEGQLWNKAREYLTYLQISDVRHLNDSFLENNVATFILPSFLSKYNNKYLDNIILLSVYKDGMLNLKIITIKSEEDTHDKLFKIREPLNKVDIVKRKKGIYVADDFFNKESLYNAYDSDIIEYYISLLESILEKVELTYDLPKYGQVEFSVTKDSGVLSSSELLLFLLNADEEYVSGIRKDDADTQIKKLQIMRRKNLSVYSNDIALVQDIHEAVLEEQWRKVKKDDEINEYITSLSPLEKTSYKEETKERIFISSLVENGRIHEIAILKKSKYRFLCKIAIAS